MPEIPNVVSGEPVEADWGNDIRDRSVQKYADLSALLFSQPLPQLGEMAWLTDPGWLVVCTDVVAPATWTPLLDRDQSDGRWVNLVGDTMTGGLTAPALTSTGTVKANVKLEGPIESWFADSSGIVNVNEVPTVIGRFTTPSPGASGRFLIIAQLQYNFANLDANSITLRIMQNGTTQRAVASANLPAQWSGPGITSGLGNVGVQIVTPSVGPGTFFDITVGTGVPPAGSSPTVNATDLDWYAHRVFATSQVPFAVESLWTP